MAQNTEKRPVIGLALGGGMARGCAHVGVLRELERHQIPIDLIAGTSVGSLIGGAYAAGLSPDQVEQLALNISWSDLGRATVSLMGFYNSERTEDYVRKHFPVTEFEKTRIPFERGSNRPANRQDGCFYGRQHSAGHSSQLRYAGFLYAGDGQWPDDG